MKKNQETLIDVFKKKGANISATCNAMNISRQTFYRWLKESPELMQEVEDSKEALIDNVETKLLSSINEGNIQAILFYLRTKGKSRGYVERSEITGADGQRLFNVQIIDSLDTGDLHE
jgi:transposase-like protein